MEDLAPQEIQELKHIAGDLEKKKHFYACKWIFLFSFAGLLFVMTAVFVQEARKEGVATPPSSAPELHSIPQTHESKAEAAAEFDQRVRELGNTLDASVQEGAQETPFPSTSSGSAKVPDGPSPVEFPIP